MTVVRPTIVGAALEIDVIELVQSSEVVGQCRPQSIPRRRGQRADVVQLTSTTGQLALERFTFDRQQAELLIMLRIGFALTLGNGVSRFGLHGATRCRRLGLCLGLKPSGLRVRIGNDALGDRFRLPNYKIGRTLRERQRSPHRFIGFRCASRGANTLFGPFRARFRFGQ